MKNDQVYIKHIKEAVNKIEKYLAGVSFETFSTTDLLIDGVVRELTIIGEAAAKISEEFKENHPKIPFFEMIGMRNRIIHEYFSVNVKTVWETCQSDLPTLKRTLKNI